MTYMRIFTLFLTVLSILALSAAQTPSVEQQQHPLEEVVRQLSLDHADAINSRGDAAKHTPVIHVASDRCRITIPHEMNPSKPHFIQYLWAIDESSDDDNRILGIKAFDASRDRVARLTVQATPGSTMRAFAYCNDHGLWASDAIQIPSSDGSGDEL